MLSADVDTMLFVLKQYEEEVNYKLLTEEEEEAGMYYKLNEKVLLRTDSKTQMEILRSASDGGIYSKNEARRKLDMQDKEGGDELIVNGTFVPLKNVGAAYPGGKASGEQEGQEDEPADPDDPIEEEPETEETEEGEEKEGGDEDDEDDEDEFHKEKQEKEKV